MADRIYLARATDSNGDIVSGAKATFFAKGTSTPLVVYSDEGATTPVSPPLLADSEGVFADTYTTAPVKVTVTDTLDVNLPGYPSDPHYISPAGQVAAANISFTPITGNAADDVAEAIQNNTNRWFGTAPETMGYSQSDLNTETEVDFTGIPSWAGQIEIIFKAASLSGTDNILVQIGDSGGMETTGYVASGISVNGSTVGAGNSTAGFYVRVNGAANAASGILTLSKDIATNDWAAAGNFRLGGTTFSSAGGAKLLSDTLTQVRITRDGTDTFDNGTVSIRWRV